VRTAGYAYGANGAIRSDLLQEKEPAFDSTATARRVCVRYRSVAQRPCELARLPVGAENPVAQVKLGRTYSPANYARAYVRRWQANGARFDEG
jgi:hypothetical protein